MSLGREWYCFAMGNITEKPAGAADIELGGLLIWVHGRQFEQAMDYWDGNWLRVTVNCSALGADVWISGPKIHLPEIEKWKEESVTMYSTMAGSASLDCMEPELNVKTSVDKLGHLAVIIDITPHLGTQRHQFKFELDQSYLPKVISGCKSVLERFPIRDKEQIYRRKSEA